LYVSKNTFACSLIMTRGASIAAGSSTLNPISLPVMASLIARRSASNAPTRD
jgi:hypothetical protein